MQNQILNGVSSTAVNPNLDYVDVFQQLEQALKSDVQSLQLLLSQGVITQNQGNYLLSQLAQKEQKIRQCKQLMAQNAATFQQVNTNQNPVESNEAVQDPFDVFNQENPGFFDKVGRTDVLNYIKNLDMDKDEISKIAKLIETLETSAVDSYLKKSDHDKSLNDENLIAKSKLTSYAQNTSSDGNTSRIFTREDIGAMSGEEFAKNEKLICEQAKQGLIK